MIIENDFSYNEDGFPVDEKGNFIHAIDEKGNCIISFENSDEFVFCPTDKQQVRQAIKKIAKILSENFSKNLEN
jgi:hypothetical protein